MSHQIRSLLDLHEPNEHERQATIHLLRAILTVTLMAIIVVLIAEGVVGGRSHVVFALLPLIAFVLLSIFLLERNILWPARVLVPLSIWSVLTYLLVVGGGLHDAAMLAYAAVLIIASLTLGANAPIVFGALIVAVVIALGALEINHIIVNTGSFMTSRGEVVLSSIIILTIAGLQRLSVKRLNASLRQVRQSEQEQIKANRALQESEALYHSLVEALPMSVCRKDLVGRFTFSNQQFCDGFNKSLAEIVGKTDYDLHPVELADKHRQDDQWVTQTGQILEAVEEHKTLEGDTSYVQVFKSPLWDAEHKITGVQIMFWDVSERKRAEREQEILQRLALELTAPLTLKELVKLLAVCCRQLFSHGSFRFDLYDEQEQLRTPVYAEDTPAEGQEPLDIETESEAKQPEAIRAVFDGKPVLVNRKPGTITDDLTAWGFASRRSQSMLFAPMRRQGHCIGVVSVQSYTPERYGYRDLMLLQMLADQCGAALARVQADGALRMNEQRYRALFERTSDAVFLLNLDGVHLAVNQRAAQLLGYSQEEMVGMSSRQIVAPEEHVNSAANMQALLSGKSLPIYERTFVKKDGTRLSVEINAAMVYDQNGQPMHIQSIIRDISERKQAEAGRESLIAELEAKNTELERFTYTVSHDLKAPLVTIRGFLGFVEKDLASGKLERLKADIARIASAADKMQQLLNELLELSRIGRMMNPPEMIPFEAIAREAVELVRGRIEARGVQVEIAPGLPTVFGDRARLVEVVQNLVDNACKFMGDQAAPRIEIGTIGADADGKPMLFVRDNGIGIEPQYHERVFGLFNKLDAQTEGTGIGLALVKRIVEVHGGRIWVESEGTGKGATFCFTLGEMPITR